MLATAHVFSPLKPDRETPTRAGLAACFSTFTATDLEAMMLTNCDAIRSVYNLVASYLIWSLDDWQEARKGQCWCAGGLSFPGRSARGACQKSADRSEEADCVSSKRRSACSLAGLDSCSADKGVKSRTAKRATSVSFTYKHSQFQRAVSCSR